MKKTTIITAFFLAALVMTTAAPVALAQEGSTYQDRVEERRTLFGENSQERQANREEIRTQVGENVQERQDTRQERRETRRDSVAQFHATRLTNRFGFYSQRLTNLIEKVDTKLSEMASEGKDVAAAQVKLDEAQSALNESKSLGSQAIAAFEAIEPAEYETQRDQALAARDLAQQARESYKEAVSLMKEAVKLAKGAN